MRGFGAVVRNELRLFFAESEAAVLLTVTPLAVAAVLEDVVGTALADDGRAVGGAQFALAGQAVLFAFFITGYASLSFFREHAWHTWGRLRAAPVTAAAVVLAKVLPWYLVGCLQFAFVFGAGVVLFDLDVQADQWAGLALVSAAYLSFVVAFTVLLVAWFSSMIPVNAVSNLGAVVFGAVGGAVVPHDDLPEWAQRIAPALPTHWVMEGFDRLLVDGRGSGAVLGPSAIVGAFALGCLVVGLARFRATDTKTSLS